MCAGEILFICGHPNTGHISYRGRKKRAGSAVWTMCWWKVSLDTPAARAAGKILLAAENWFSSGGKDKKYSCAEKNFPAKCQIKKLIIIWLQILMFIFYYVHIGVNFQQCLIKYFISRISEVGVHKTLHNKLRVCNFLFAACRADTSSLN